MEEEDAVEFKEYLFSDMFAQILFQNVPTCFTQIEPAPNSRKLTARVRQNNQTDYYCELRITQEVPCGPDSAVLKVLTPAEIGGKTLIVKFSPNAADAAIHTQLWRHAHLSNYVIPLVSELAPQWRIEAVYGSNARRRGSFKVMEDYSDFFLRKQRIENAPFFQHLLKQFVAAVPALRHDQDWHCTKKNVVVVYGKPLFFDFDRL